MNSIQQDDTFWCVGDFILNLTINIDSLAAESDSPNNPIKSTSDVVRLTSRQFYESN